MTRQPPPAEFTGIGMTDKYLTTNTAPLWFAAAEILKLSGRMYEHELWGGDPSRGDFIRRDLKVAVTRLADFVGCDLVPRLTPAEAHEAAIERFNKWSVEDGPPPVTDAPGFDGRAKVVGQDDRDPVGQVLR